MTLKLTAIAALVAAVLPMTAHADLPGEHPGYLHALTDLRAARWSLGHRPGDTAVSMQEDIAISEVDRAIGEVRKAVHEDEKKFRDKPQEDANVDRPGRLHHALDLLKKAHDEIDHEEDNPEVRGLKQRSLTHIDLALEAARHAVHDIEQHH